MSRAVVPIAQLQRRLPEAGRLRTGVRTAKAAKAIPTWRFTSHDEEAIRQVAAIYGGDPHPWVEGPKGAPTPGQWEVITEAAELRIVLPPSPLGDGPTYELWSGGGCERRCDGITCTTFQKGPDGPEPVDIPCICATKGALACKPHTRLSVLLPDVKFGGTWRYQSSSSHQVAEELPGMVDLIQSQAQGLTHALLGIQHRKGSGGKRYTIPVLRVPATMNELAAGQSRFGALPVESHVRAIEAWKEDDEVVDAEIVDESRATLQAVLSGLPREARESLKVWWAEQGLPKVDDLDDMQVDAVWAHIEERF